MNVAIVVAAGRGSRAGGGQAKQFREISGIPIIIRTLQSFERCATVNQSVVVVPAGGEEELLALAERYGLRKVVRAVPGGETRAESVWRGLQTLREAGLGVVAIHDGVRPFGAQVRTRVGRSLKPDSSINTISLPSAQAFF